MEYNGNDENKIYDGVAAGAARITSQLTTKLLVNPNSKIQKQTHGLGPLDVVERRHAAGVRWRDQEESGEAIIRSQRPLLDGGEGKLKTSVTTDIMNNEEGHAKVSKSEFAGLEPPTLDTTGGHVTGADTPQHRIENKRRRRASLATQMPKTQWTTYKGEFELPPRIPPLKEHRGEMCPSGLALHHPAADLLKEWATYGCPTKTGRPWTISQLQEAVDRGPHRSALSDEAINHFQAEVAEKVKMGQAKLVAWDSIKEAPPRELKISPIAAISHKSKQFRSILDLSFHLRLKQGGILLSVNATTVKMAPKGAIDQLGHSLLRIIYAFAETEDDARIFLAKWDIKDGFWWMDAEEGAEWNFSYVLPQRPSQPIYLVVPTSLQMGWVESPPFFCVASETARDVSHDYCETKLGTLPNHKFTNYVTGNKAYDDLPESDNNGNAFRYLL